MEKMVSCNILLCDVKGSCFKLNQIENSTTFRSDRSRREKTNSTSRYLGTNCDKDFIIAQDYNADPIIFHESRFLVPIETVSQKARARQEP